MTQEQQTRRVHDLLMRAADKMAAAGVHPVAIVEGGLAAMLHLTGHVMGNAALAAWMRDAANEIDGGTIPDGVTVQ